MRDLLPGQMALLLQSGLMYRGSRRAVPDRAGEMIPRQKKDPQNLPVREKRVRAGNLQDLPYRKGKAREENPPGLPEAETAAVENSVPWNSRRVPAPSGSTVRRRHGAGKKQNAEAA